METYWIACRELWRESNLRIILAGGKPGKEPNFRPKRGKSRGDKSGMRLALAQMKT